MSFSLMQGQRGGCNRLPRSRRAWLAAAVIAAALFPGAVQAAGAQAGAASQPTGGIATPRPVIGVIDQQRVMADSTAARAASTQKDKFQDVYQAFTADEEKRLRVLDEKLSTERGTLSSEMFNARMTEFQSQVNEFQKLLQLKRRNLERAYAQAITEVQNTVVRITEEVATERGMNLVLYRSQAFLFDPKMDLTNEVIARLNRVLPSVTMTDPEKIDTETPATKKGGR